MPGPRRDLSATPVMAMTEEARRAIEVADLKGPITVYIVPADFWGHSDKHPLPGAPEPFHLDVRIIERGDSPYFDRALGRVDAAGHPLAGFWVFLAQRNRPPDGDYDIAVFDAMPEVLPRSSPPPGEALISGYALVGLVSRLEAAS
jgi:hypothetical protein